MGINQQLNITFTKNEPATSFGTNQPGPSPAEFISAG
jgi:hypothetical protein